MPSNFLKVLGSVNLISRTIFLSKIVVGTCQRFPSLSICVEDVLWTAEDVLNSVECGVNLFIIFSKLLLLDFRCWLFSVLHFLFMFKMFIFMGQITRSTFVVGG